MSQLYLFPGQFVVMSEKATVTTVLGSCVAVALFDAKKRIAGMNHFLLPQAKNMEQENSGLRYGIFSLSKMLDEMLHLGASQEHLQAKVYGGARVLENVGLGDSVGRQNIDCALNWLGEKKIPVVSNDIGGTAGRKIILNTFDFSVKVQLLNGIKTVDPSGSNVQLIARPARVVIVDSSASGRTLLSRILAQSGRVEVVGVACDAFEAREVIVEQEPDVVLLDLEIPGLSALKFLEKLMHYFPTPTIMLSAGSASEPDAMQAIELGAQEVIQKPTQFDPAALGCYSDALLQKVLASASTSERLKKQVSISSAESLVQVKHEFSSLDEVGLILVGGNGGAHRELALLLQVLPANAPPVLVAVSSVAAHLSGYFDKWKTTSQMQLQPAVDGLKPRQGNVYFATANEHLHLEDVQGEWTLKLSHGAPQCLQQPSSEILFQSVISALSPEQVKKTICFLFSGLGVDGVQGLLLLRERGARTVVIHPGASVFPFLPQSAIAAGAADDVVQPEELKMLFAALRGRTAS
ncbi:MAG: hypothetical protein RIR26_1157 [Pseudomonadota bacterium]|jgi:two-component system chemotaxis response regulator CheB